MGANESQLQADAVSLPTDSEATAEIGIETTISKDATLATNAEDETTAEVPAIPPPAVPSVDDEKVVLTSPEQSEAEDEPPQTWRTQVHAIKSQISQLEIAAGIEQAKVTPMDALPSSKSSSSQGNKEGSKRTARSVLSSFRSSRTLTFRSQVAHSDPKKVVDGLSSISVQAALNQPTQLKVAITQKPKAVNVCDMDGDRFPLHWAAARGHMRCVRYLLRAGANRDAVDSKGRTAAELALETGATEAHNLLMYGEAGDDPKPMSGAMARDALSLHCALKQPRELQAILDKGMGFHANPNRLDKDGDRRPIHWAAARGAIECCQLLLDAGADLSHVDAQGRTAADLARLTNQRATYHLLTEAMEVRQAEMLAHYGIEPPSSEDDEPATGAGPHDTEESVMCVVVPSDSPKAAEGQARLQKGCTDGEAEGGTLAGAGVLGITQVV